MRTAFGLAAGLGLAGCSFSGGSLPPGSSEITGSVMNRTARNNTDLVPEVMDLPAAGTMLRFRFDDGSETTVTTDGNGTFSVPRTTESYVVELDTGTTVIELREDADQLVLGSFFAGRAAEPVTQATPVVLPVFPPTGFVVLASIGQWTSTNVFEQQFDWRLANPTGGLPVGLLEAQTDRLFALQYEEDVFAPKQVAISRLASAAVDMQDGAPVDLSDNLLPLLPDHCVSLAGKSESMVQRLVESLGAGYRPPERQWSILAAPASETRMLGAVPVVSTTAETLDFDRQASFAQPLPNHDLLVSASALAVRVVTIPGSTAEITVVDGVVGVYAAGMADECDGNITELVDVDVAVVESVELDGQRLVADQQVIQVQRPDDLTATWDEASGEADYYEVQLLEVVADEDNKAHLELVRGFRSRSKEIAIAESLLVSGRSYVLRIIAVVGQPAAAEGNYLDLVYPAGNSFQTSPVFRVE